MAIQYAKRNQADIILVCDPDADTQRSTDCIMEIINY